MSSDAATPARATGWSDPPLFFSTSFLCFCEGLYLYLYLWRHVPCSYQDGIRFATGAPGRDVVCRPSPVERAELRLCALLLLGGGLPETEPGCHPQT